MPKRDTPNSGGRASSKGTRVASVYGARAKDEVLVAGAYWTERSFGRLASIEIPVLELQMQGLRPRTPEESLLTTLPLASCQRLPSGRHRTGKLDGASDLAVALRSQSGSTGFQPCSTSGHGLKTRVKGNSASEPTEAPTSLWFGVFRRGAASMGAGGGSAGCGGGAGAEPLRL